MGGWWVLITGAAALRATQPFKTVLTEYADVNITNMLTKQSFSPTTFPLADSPVVCNSVVYTSHDGRRSEDAALDVFRVKWAQAQPRRAVCMLHIHSLATAFESQLDQDVKQAWARRGSPNDPRVLVDRYKAGLLVMALIHERRIVSSTSSPLGYIPILYVDGDTMMTNTAMSVFTLIKRVELASSQRTSEDRACELRPKTFRCSDSSPFEEATSSSSIALVASISNNCDRGYFTHSGVLLFRKAPLTGFLFDTLSRSAETALRTGRYRMGDQAVWDWLTEVAFGVDWRRINKLCQSPHRALTRTACLYPELLMRRSIRPVYQVSEDDEGARLLAAMTAKWASMQNGTPTFAVGGPRDIAWACVRWFNAPSCAAAMRNDPLHSFHCGDFLWHLYGCRKSSWRDGFLDAQLKSSACRRTLPS